MCVSVGSDGERKLAVSFFCKHPNSSSCLARQLNPRHCSTAVLCVPRKGEAEATSHVTNQPLAICVKNVWLLPGLCWKKRGWITENDGKQEEEEKFFTPLSLLPCTRGMVPNIKTHKSRFMAWRLSVLLDLMFAISSTSSAPLIAECCTRT